MSDYEGEIHRDMSVIFEGFLDHRSYARRDGGYGWSLDVRVISLYGLLGSLK